VAQWSSRPPQEWKISGSNPGKVWDFSSIYLALLFLKYNMQRLCVNLRKINAAIKK
jgi:hypothetical protein